jgi:hypothetical protein
MGTKLTDAGARHLESLTSLRELIIDEHIDGISNDAYYRLLNAIPGLIVGSS